MMGAIGRGIIFYNNLKINVFELKAGYRQASLGLCRMARIACRSFTGWIVAGSLWDLFIIKHDFFVFELVG